MSSSLQPHGLQDARLPRPLWTPGAYSNSCPWSQWCHPTVSSSVILFSLALNLSQYQGLFQWVTGVSASASVLPVNIQDWFPLGLTGLISLQFKGLSKFFFNTTVQKHQFLSTQLSLESDSHIHTWLLENHSFDRWTFVGKVMSLLFNKLSRLVTAFFQRERIF